MSKKKMILIICLVVVTVAASIGGTMAYITASSQPVVNTFTVGQVQITLSETTGPTYQLVPGMQILKDPAITVLAESDACWLFFRMEETYNLSAYAIYAPASDWTPLEGVQGVYFRRVEDKDENQVFSLLEGDLVTVPDTVTEEDLALIQNAPDLRFTGYAVQSAGIATAQEAWQQLAAEGVSER